MDDFRRLIAREFKVTSHRYAKRDVDGAEVLRAIEEYNASKITKEARRCREADLVHARLIWINFTRLLTALENHRRCGIILGPKVRATKCTRFANALPQDFDS